MPTNSKKYRVEEPQPTTISVISGNDREMIEEKKCEALEKLKQYIHRERLTTAFIADLDLRRQKVNLNLNLKRNLDITATPNRPTSPRFRS